MKRICATLLFLAILVLVSVSTVSCSKRELYLGIGIYENTESVSASAKDGYVMAELTAAAVLMDNSGKIIAITTDAAEYKTVIGKDGKGKLPTDRRTKRELGDEYGMKAAGAKHEWYEEADIFSSLAIGKTRDEIASLITDNGMGSEAVVNAGCTIAVDGLYRAIYDATEHKSKVSAGRRARVNLKLSPTLTLKDPKGDQAGEVIVKVDIEAGVSGGEGSVSDSLDFTFTFDSKGNTLVSDK